MPHFQPCLTRNGDVGCGLGIATDTAVESTVLQLCVLDGHLQQAVSIPYLVLEVSLQQLLPFPPLRSAAGLGQLAAQRHAVLFLHFLVP